MNGATSASRLEAPARRGPRGRPDPTTRRDDGTLRGATPIYLFLPAVAGELKRYNPGLKLIVLLRDPVERAISHFYMEKNRDKEHLPLWLALLAEPFRLRRREDASHVDSHLRRHAYRRRGLYSLQLRNLYPIGTLRDIHRQAGWPWKGRP